MKPVRTFPPLARLLAWLILVACAIQVHAAPSLPDPLAGDWLYWNNHDVTFNADGTARWRGKHGYTGTWEYLHNPEVQRHYRIVWDRGKSVDFLVLAEARQSAHVRNETGDKHEQYDVRRAIPNRLPR